MNVQTKDGLQQDGAGYVVGADHYISPEFAKLEAENLWYRVWQMACREEEIPEVGDHVVYDVVGLSFIVVRSAPGEIKAFVKGKLAPFKYPRWVAFVDDLPKTATGKIQRFRLRDREGFTG